MKRVLVAGLAITFVLICMTPADARTPILISSSGLSRDSITIQLGHTVSWTNELDRDVTVVSGPLAYWQADVAKGATAGAAMTLAGKWSYALTDDPNIAGLVRVPPQVSDATVQVGQWFTITAASQDLSPGYQWDLLRARFRRHLGTLVGGIKSASFDERINLPGTFVFAIRTFGYNPSVGYNTYTPRSPRITVTVTA